MSQKHSQQLWLSIRGASGFPGGFPKAWKLRSHHMHGAPVTLPLQVPSYAQAEAIFLAFQLEFQALEKQLLTHRKEAAKQRRSDDVNVIFKDVAKPRSLPVQTVVSRKVATVTEVSEDGLTLQYSPQELDDQTEVEGPQGWLQIAEHSPGTMILSQEGAVEVGDQITQKCMHGGVREVFQAFTDLSHRPPSLGCICAQIVA